MAKFSDITGKVFGKLTVIRRSEKVGAGKVPLIYWDCQCECGSTVAVRGTSLRKGDAKSCGCGMARFQAKHGMSHSHLREYRAWRSMLKRCSNADGHHATYVNNGITVCPEWVDDFPRFFQDMGVIVPPFITLDRIDNSKGYSKENCRWATHKQQNLNYSRNRNLTYQGVTMTITEWAEHFGISRHRIYQRLNSGWDLERVFA